MKRFSILACLLGLLLAAVPVLAVDVWGGPPEGTWSRGDAYTTFEHWMFENGPVGPPEVYFNPYGEPVADILYGEFEWGMWECPPEMDPNGEVPGIHCASPDGGAIVLHIPNNPHPNRAKWIYVQITSSKAPTNVTATGMGGYPPYSSGTWSTGRPAIQWPDPAPFGGVWYTYSYGLVIYPNPDWEDVVIEVPFCTVIDQIVVDTICSDIVANETESWSDGKALYR
jgi:hypothetical protein